MQGFDSVVNQLHYMPSEYDCSSWKFIQRILYEDIDYKQRKKRMRNADRASQFSDDDCLEGVLCSSCRLAVNKDTGRLKWCMGGNDVWRARIRYMLLIPAIILPIMIIFIVLSRSSTSGRNTLQSTQGDEDNRGEGIIDRQRFVSTDNFEAENDALTSHIDTKFVSTDNLAQLKNTQRQKRNLRVKGDGILYHPRMTYDSDAKNLFYEDDTPGYRKSNIEKDYLEVLQELQNVRNSTVPDDKNGNENSEETIYEETTELGVFDEESGDWNDLEEDEVTDKTVANDFDDDEDSWRKGGEDDDDYPQSPCENEDETEIFFDNEPWMPIDDTAVDESLEFQSFWKGDAYEKNVRKQQAKMMLKYMDKTANPCQDFYQYACGNWAKHNPIPKDKVGYDTFEMLRESLDLVLKELLEESINHVGRHRLDNAIVKAKNLYKSCMNQEILEQRQEKPLLKLLDDLGGWPVLDPSWDPDKFDWLVLVAQLRLYNNNILLSEWIGPDIKNSDQYVIQFDQTSLGLPTRDYFLQPSYKMYLEAYKNYFIKIVTLLGSPMEKSISDADEIIEFEAQLARITSLSEERRNVTKLYQRMTLGELEDRIPEVDWQHYLTIVLDREVQLSEPIIIFAFKYIQNLVLLLEKTPPRIISNYVLWRFVRLRVNNLDERFQEAKQKFYYTLFGREQAPPKWKLCVSQVNANMGMALGSLFVRRYFDENSKNDTLTMTRELQQSFREILNKTCWIGDETKELATAKVDAMLLRIGYPDYILDQKQLDECYEGVNIHPDKYFENILNILRYLTKVEQNRLGTPVNKTMWNTAPAVVNAYYNRYKNQIIFPAGILQPPFYHKYYPKCLNYGGIGVVIGHEITHGFDDKGRLFDKSGNLNRWWKDEDIKKFQERAQCLIDQYNRFTVTEVNMKVDGVNTQGENIADNGGIKQAYSAYEKWLSVNGDTKETLPGINATSRQLFFLNFAQVWCGSLRPEATRNRLKTAVHSPGKYRVIGTLSNFKEFAQVFKCPLGSPMNPVKKCSVW